MSNKGWTPELHRMVTLWLLQIGKNHLAHKNASIRQSTIADRLAIVLAILTGVTAITSVSAVWDISDRNIRITLAIIGAVASVTATSLVAAISKLKPEKSASDNKTAANLYEDLSNKIQVNAIVEDEDRPRASEFLRSIIESIAMIRMFSPQPGSGDGSTAELPNIILHRLARKKGNVGRKGSLISQILQNRPEIAASLLKDTGLVDKVMNNSLKGSDDGSIVRLREENKKLQEQCKNLDFAVHVADLDHDSSAQEKAANIADFIRQGERRKSLLPDPQMYPALDCEEECDEDHDNQGDVVIEVEPDEVNHLVSQNLRLRSTLLGLCTSQNVETKTVTHETRHRKESIDVLRRVEQQMDDLNAPSDMFSDSE